MTKKAEIVFTASFVNEVMIGLICVSCVGKCMLFMNFVYDVLLSLSFIFVMGVINFSKRSKNFIVAF